MATAAPRRTLLGRMGLRKSVELIQHETRTSELKRSLGPWNLVFLGIAQPLEDLPGGERCFIVARLEDDLVRIDTGLEAYLVDLAQAVDDLMVSDAARK